MAMRIDTAELIDGQGVAAVHARLRDAILYGELRPGQAISQVQLARDLGVSRTPLREAIRMLQREGLLEGEPNKRVRVASFSLEDMQELYALRITVEALAVRLTVPQLSDDDISQLDELLSEMSLHADAEDYERYSEPHRAFHAGLVAGAGSRIRQLLAELSDHGERYRRLHTTQAPRAWSTAAEEHRAILDACVQRDADLAAVRLAEHLAHTVLGNLELLDPDYRPLALRRSLRAVQAGAGHEPGQQKGPA
jgi:DNA-binding GntR family transcriptional regulator